MNFYIQKENRMDKVSIMLSMGKSNCWLKVKEMMNSNSVKVLTKENFSGSVKHHIWILEQIMLEFQAKKLLYLN